ncbi:MAG TPA: hypothetical protein VMS89_04000 [Methanoregulaceae archaeon]|nr:hypothetical protein [Methanoregulaceae archaeon]
MIEGRKYRVVPKWGKRDNDVLGNYEREWKPTVCEERGSPNNIFPGITEEPGLVQ